MVEGTGRVVSVGPPVGAYVRLRDGAGSEVRCARYEVCRWADKLGRSGLSDPYVPAGAKEVSGIKR